MRIPRRPTGAAAISLIPVVLRLAHSKILRRQTSALCDSGEHAWPDLFVLVEREHEIGPALTGEGAVRARLSFHAPANPKERRQNSLGASAGPARQAALNEMSRRSGPASPCSSLSATTRSASAWTRAWASAGDAPYAKTPGSSGTSPSQRPSSSRSISTLNLTSALRVSFYPDRPAPECPENTAFSCERRPSEARGARQLLRNELSRE
jgi:hypothetical protein